MLETDLSVYVIGDTIAVLERSQDRGSRSNVGVYLGK